MSRDSELQEIIDAYNKLVGGIEEKAVSSTDGRAYGGIIRAEKGQLVESIARRLVELAWKQIGSDKKLAITRKPILVPINKQYLESLRDKEVKAYIEKNLKDYMYSYTPDALVLINDAPAVEIECKAYTENAMLKRILVDATLTK